MNSGRLELSRLNARSSALTVNGDPRLLARFDQSAGRWCIAAGTYTRLGARGIRQLNHAARAGKPACCSAWVKNCPVTAAARRAVAYQRGIDEQSLPSAREAARSYRGPLVEMVRPCLSGGGKAVLIERSMSGICAVRSTACPACCNCSGALWVIGRPSAGPALGRRCLQLSCRPRQKSPPTALRCNILVRDRPGCAWREEHAISDHPYSEVVGIGPP